MQLSLSQIREIVESEVFRIIKEAHADTPKVKHTEREHIRTILGGKTQEEFAKEFATSVATVSRRVRSIMIPQLKRERGEEPSEAELKAAVKASKQLNLGKVSRLNARSGSEMEREAQSEEDADIFLPIAREYASSPKIKLSAEEIAINPSFQDAVITLATEWRLEVDFLHAKMKELAQELESIVDKDPIDDRKYLSVIGRMRILMRELGIRLDKDVSEFK